MQTLQRQMRFHGKAAAEGLFKSWGAGDVGAAKAAFTSDAAVSFVSSETLHRIPFSGRQNAGDFFEAFSSSLEKSSVSASNILADDDSFAAVVQYDFEPKRNNRPGSVEAFVFGKVANDGKISSLVARADVGTLEAAFDPHGPSTKGTENKWDA